MSESRYAKNDNDGGPPDKSGITGDDARVLSRDEFAAKLFSHRYAPDGKDAALEAGADIQAHDEALRELSEKRLAEIAGLVAGGKALRAENDSRARIIDADVRVKADLRAERARLREERDRAIRQRDAARHPDAEVRLRKALIGLVEAVEDACGEDDWLHTEEQAVKRAREALGAG